MTRQLEELIFSNQTKDRIYAVAAHDLRSPVYSLKQQLVEVDKALAGNHINHAAAELNKARTIAERSYALLNNILYWALSQVDELFFQQENLLLSAIVQQACYDYRPVATARDIFIRENIPGTFYISADLNSCRIVLRNLLDNAIKYTLPGGTVEITALLIDHECCVKITDTGIGMSESVLGSVFNNGVGKIKQDPNSNTGTGLGLRLCRLLAEKNKGHIEIQSQPGKGTEVLLFLPVAALF